MAQYNFVINGAPMGKGRPRIERRQGKDGQQHTVARTPNSTLIYENLVRLEFKEQLPGVWLDGAFEAEITAIYEIPASKSAKAKAQMLSGAIPCTKRPDCDNIAKIILDALNGFAYHDDASASMVKVRKLYGKTPMVLVTLRDVEVATP